jgi:hypothetical protein
MSNHLTLKPSTSGGLSREDDFRITGPNVALGEVRAQRARRPPPPPQLSLPHPAAALANNPPTRHALQVPELLKKDCLLFYYPDCASLARRIAHASRGNVELAEISWK